MKNSINAIIAGLMLVVSAVACNKEPLKKLEKIELPSVLPTNSVEVDFCTMEADKVRSKLKFIFIVDKSGSNKLTDPRNGAPPSDPDGARRYVPIKSFVESNPEPVDENDESVTFALINFSSEANTIKGPQTGKQFMQKGEFYNLAEREHHPNGAGSFPNDEGYTNYLGAIAELRKVVTDDIAAARNKAKLTGKAEATFYVVFFVSDGFPQTGAGPQTKTDIINSVLSVKGLEETDRLYVDAIQFNTGYYYGSASFRDPGAAEILEDLAKPNVGAGTFLEFQVGDAIDFGQFAPPERNVRHLLKDIVISNMNTLWQGGKMERDSDADGLIDSLEEKLGSDPEMADSDSNGVRDGIEFFAMGAPCKDTNCNPENAELYPSCNAIPEGRSNDIDNDTINNCEEKVLSASHTEFDSNGDWMPDELAWRQNLAFLSGSNEINLDRDNDNLKNYDEVKRFTPIGFNNEQVEDLSPYKYELKKISSNDKQDCYNLKVTDIQVLSKNDTIRVWVLEQASVLEDRRYVRYVDKQFTAIGETMFVKKSDFPVEE